MTDREKPAPAAPAAPAGFPGLPGLSPGDVERIDRAARDLLADPGVRVEHEEIAALLVKRGGRPGAGTGVVRFPEAMLDEHLALAPERFALADRRGGRHVAAPDSPPVFWTGAALFYVDERGFRPIGRQDLADFSRVIDRLENVDGIVGTSVEEASPAHRDFAGLRIMAENTSKHLRALSFTPRGGEALIEMGRVLAGGRSLRENPVISVGFTAHGPLRWTNLALGMFRATAGHGIPCTVNGEPMAGASSPVTLAGAAAVGAAEILSGIVINQALEPGRPCFFNLGFAHVMDMRAGFAVTGGPENALLAAVGAELARRYRLPSVSWMCSDSLHYDAQNALEKMLNAAAQARARVSVIWGVGQLESEKTLSPVQAAVDNEILGLTRRFLAGFEVNDETLAVEEIRRVGIAGEFLGSGHTLEHFRGQIYEPRLLVRQQRSLAGKRDRLEARAEDFVRGVLAAEREPLLPPEQSRELEAIERRYQSIIR